MMTRIFTILLVALLFVSCKTYVTPGSSVNISQLADQDIKEILTNEGAAEFPVNIAIARIQAPGYTNYRQQFRGYGNTGTVFSMILTRDVEEDEAFERLSSMDGIEAASPFNRLLLPYEYNSIKDLRLAAAKMKAEVLLVYTFDTDFVIETKN